MRPGQQAPLIHDVPLSEAARADGVSDPGGLPAGTVVDDSGIVTSSPGGIAWPPEDPVRPWPWWIAPVGILLAVLAIIVAGVGFGIVVAAFGGSTTDSVSDYDYLFGLLQDGLWIAVAVATPLLVVRWVRPEHLGLRRRHPGFSLLKLVLVLFTFYVLAAVYASALGLDDNSNQLLQDTGFGVSVWKDVAYAILYPVAAPVAEELLFRGILFKGLRDGMRRRLPRPAAVGVAALISGSVFGAAHYGGGQDKYIPVLIALGVLLAVAYEWSGTLYVPIAIHSLNNAIATGTSSHPTHDWVFVLIGAGPILAILLAFAVGRLVRLLPSTPRPTLPPSIPTSPSAWPGGGPQSDRPLGL